MDYRQLGDSGLRVSPLCIGTMLFGDRTDVNESKRIVDSGFDAGINFIDTADAYVTVNRSASPENSLPAQANSAEFLRLTKKVR